LVFCLATERLEFTAALLDDELLEKVGAVVFAMSGKSVTSTLFTFKCRIGLAEGFPAILHTTVQTFFIEVRLLILDTRNCQDLCLVDFIMHLVLAWMMQRFSILAEVGQVFTFE